MRVVGIGIAQMDDGRLGIDGDPEGEVLDLLLPFRPPGMRNANGFDHERPVLERTREHLDTRGRWTCTRSDHGVQAVGGDLADARHRLGRGVEAQGGTCFQQTKDVDG